MSLARVLYAGHDSEVSFLGRYFCGRLRGVAWFNYIEPFLQNTWVASGYGLEKFCMRFSVRRERHKKLSDDGVALLYQAMRTANPALKEGVFTESVRGGSAEAMTINGTVNRTGFLILLLVGAAWFSWTRSAPGPGGAIAANPFILIGAIGGFVIALVTVFKKTIAPITAPVYAVLEGLFLGGLSAMFEARFGGITAQATFGTFGTLAGLLLAYRTGLIKATENFKLGVFAATAGIAILYLVSFVLSFFGKSIPYIHQSGWVGIGFSVFVVIIAALNLVLDFDFIENGAAAGAPKYMEWYAAFGLLVTLVWLYIEILRLLAKLRSR